MRRSLVKCYNEQAVNICDSHSPSPSNKGSQSTKLTSKTPESVICFYKTKLCTHDRHIIRVSWCKNMFRQGPIVSIGHNLSCFSKSSENSWTLRGKKGTQVVQYRNSDVVILWDLCEASYDGGPEPIEKYYLAILCGSEICLLLGDMDEEIEVKRLKEKFSIAKFSLVYRNDYFHGGTIYSTRAKFSDSGIMHDVLVKCISDEEEGTRSPVLFVEIDKRKIFHVKRLRWNFRGNQSIYVDGLIVDMMWDVHDWFFNPTAGCALFLFRRRSGFESRLWLEEKNLRHEEQDRNEFSLMMLACKDPD